MVVATETSALASKTSAWTSATSALASETSALASETSALASKTSALASVTPSAGDNVSSGVDVTAPAILGPVIGGSVVVLCVVVCGWAWVWKKRRPSRRQATEMQAERDAIAVRRLAVERRIRRKMVAGQDRRLGRVAEVELRKTQVFPPLPMGRGTPS